MISRATDYVNKGKFVSPWRFIMVDEYQDISPDRLALIEALCESTQKQAGARYLLLATIGKRSISLQERMSILSLALKNALLTLPFIT